MAKNNTQTLYQYLRTKVVEVTGFENADTKNEGSKDAKNGSFQKHISRNNLLIGEKMEFSPLLVGVSVGVYWGAQHARCILHEESAGSL